MKNNGFFKAVSINPKNMKNAILLCFFIDGIVFIATFLLSLMNISLGILPQIIYLITVLIVAASLGKDELNRIFAWRDIPVGALAGIMVMFFGLVIIKSELNNLFQVAVPVPKGFFNNYFYEPNNILLNFIVIALLPGFTEEVIFRGVIARRFFTTYSPWKAIILSAVLFGIMHMNPWQAVNAVYAGIFFGWIYLRYRSIWLCIFIHAYHNILVTYVGFPYIPVENPGYLEIWRHPLWFDIMGILLFCFGLLTIIVTRANPQIIQKPNLANNIAK
ncbi:MAG: CPBP family intramembrane metalloprotease [Treponema sp.]|nr:CPBP family intramembrane metalloprotease [Treponema sp.]